MLRFQRLVDSVHVVLVTQRWVIGGRMDNGMLGAQHFTNHKFASGFNFNLIAVKAG